MNITHHFVITRPADKKRSPHRHDLDIKVTADLRNSAVTQAYVNEIIAHVKVCESQEPRQPRLMRDLSVRKVLLEGGVV